MHFFMSIMVFNYILFHWSSAISELHVFLVFLQGLLSIPPGSDVSQHQGVNIIKSPRWVIAMMYDIVYYLLVQFVKVQTSNIMKIADRLVSLEKIVQI